MLGKEAILKGRVLAVQREGEQRWRGTPRCEREKRHGQVWGGERGARTHRECAKERGPQREEASHLHVAP